MMDREQKYFVFDAYGTLFRISSTSTKIDGLAQGLSEPIQTLWRKKQLEYTWLRGMMDVWVNFDRITEDALDYALKFYEREYDDLKKALLDVYKTPEVFEDVKPFLSSIDHAEQKKAILSNGTTSLLKYSAKKVGIISQLDKIFSVDAVKTFKPAHKVYSMVTDYFHCLPKEVTFFSSNAWDVAGAKQFGFYTVWVNRTGVPFENLGVTPDQEIRGLLGY